MRTNRLGFLCLAFLLSLFWPRLGNAYDHLVVKRVFTLPSFTTVGGDVLKDVRFGYEMYGELNAAKDNAVLILPYFSGTGHAAGKFAETDQQPGYWDLTTPLINTLCHYTRPKVRENNGCWSSSRVNASISGCNHRSGIVGIRS